MDNNKFEYTYSAKRQEEVEAIRKKYMPKEESNLEKLRKLDRSAERPGTVLALVLGIFGTLIMGIGMSCCMVWAVNLFIPGIIIGVIGMILIGLAYPAYKYVTKKRREKIAPQIIALSEEIM